MNTDYFSWIKWIIIIGLILYAAVAVVKVVTGAEPTVIEIEMQGQQVYLGDTINVQRVLAWGNMLAFAWYDDDYYDETPDHIYEVKGDQHRFYLDPLTFKPGVYYKWAGSYERASYPVAFEILPGRRPEALPKPSGAATPVPTQTPEPGKETPKETHILLARGDDAIFEYGRNDTTTGKGYIWLFHTKGKTKSLYGEELEYNESVFSFAFEPIITEELSEGWYTGYLQFTGKNGYQDIFYDYQLNNLDTPYDDKIIPDVNLDPYIPIRIQQEFEKLAKPSQYFDDILIPITMDVRSPYILLTEYYEEDDSVIVEGITSLSEGTNITFMLDPDRWALAKDKRDHTWYTTISGGIKEPRRFLIKMKLNWDEMAIGMHTVQATVEKHKFKTEGTIQFKVSDVYVMPTPTPWIERMIVEEYGTHRPNTTNRTASLLANTTIVDNSTRVIVVNSSVDPNRTQFSSTNATVTTIPTTVPPVTTAPIPTPAPTPKPTPTIKVPVQITTILVAVGLGMIWRKRK